MAVDLKSLNCILTGASRGLGAAIAAALWRRGASLLLVGKDAGKLEARQHELGPAVTSNQELHTFVADLASPASPGHIAQKAQRLWQTLDALVNNAAIQGPIGPVWENDWDEWRETVHVNLIAPVELSKLVVPWMAESGGGSIVNLSGGGATGPRPSFSAYATAKAGLVRFSETLAAEVVSNGIRVNCVAPGSLKTDMHRQILAAGRERIGDFEFERALKCEREGGNSPERAAELVSFLISRESEGITGRLLSAVWDPWARLPQLAGELEGSDIYTLRRIIPADRGRDWDEAETAP